MGMRSARRDRARLVGKKFNKLVRKTKRTLYFTELLIKKHEKYENTRVKHIFVYDLGTRKKPEELINRLTGLEVLISDSEKFIELYEQKIRYGIQM